MAAVTGRTFADHRPRQRRRPVQLSIVAAVQGDATQGDDAGSVEQSGKAILFLGTQLAFEDGRGVVESTELKELPASPGLQQVQGPPLVTTLRVSDALVGHPQRLLKPFSDHECLRSHLLAEPPARRILPGGRRARGLLRQLD